MFAFSVMIIQEWYDDDDEEEEDERNNNNSDGKDSNWNRVKPLKF